MVTCKMHLNSSLAQKSRNYGEMVVIQKQLNFAALQLPLLPLNTQLTLAIEWVLCDVAPVESFLRLDLLCLASPHLGSELALCWSFCLLGCCVFIPSVFTDSSHGCRKGASCMVTETKHQSCETLPDVLFPRLCAWQMLPKPAGSRAQECFDLQSFWFSAHSRVPHHIPVGPGCCCDSRQLLDLHPFPNAFGDQWDAVLQWIRCEEDFSSLKSRPG